MLEQLPGLQGLYTSILGIILSVVIFSVARWVLSTLRPSHFVSLGSLYTFLDCHSRHNYLCET